MLAGTMKRLKKAVPSVMEAPPEPEIEQPNHSERAGLSRFSNPGSADEVKTGVYEGTHYPSGMYVSKCTYYPTCLLHIISSEHIPR